MKYISIICAVLFAISLSSAQEQIKQGVYNLGGTIYYSSSSYKLPYDKIEQSSYSIAPSISYFIADQCEISFGTGYTFSSFKYNIQYTNEQKSIDLNLALGIRYYIPFDKAAPFIGAGGQISWSKSYYGEADPPAFSSPSSGYYLVGGLEIFISKSAAIEPSIQYSEIRLSEYVTHNIFFAGIGVRYFIL